VRKAAAGSVLFFLAVPCVVAGVVPWLLTAWESHAWWPPVRMLGVALIVVGATGLIHAFARFVLDGLGTPAPIAPTETLVVTGLYRYVRNPMYVAVAATIAGQAFALGQPVLLAYAAAFLALVYAFVRLHEEPALRRRYGEQFERYRRTVPGWIPRRP
jgi:protein-S-isoprenylcysteine O-methyltransferase Ste14